MIFHIWFVSEHLFATFGYISFSFSFRKARIIQLSWVVCQVVVNIYTEWVTENTIASSDLTIFLPKISLCSCEEISNIYINLLWFSFVEYYSFYFWLNQKQLGLIIPIDGFYEAWEHWHKFVLVFYARLILTLFASLFRGLSVLIHSYVGSHFPNVCFSMFSAYILVMGFVCLLVFWLLHS